MARSEGDIKRNRANVIMVGLVVVSLLSIMYEVTAMPVGPKLSDGSFLEYKDYIDQVGNDTLQFTVNFTALSVRGEDVWARAVFVGAGNGETPSITEKNITREQFLVGPMGPADLGSLSKTRTESVSTYLGQRTCDVYVLGDAYTTEVIWVGNNGIVYQMHITTFAGVDRQAHTYVVLLTDSNVLGI
ncbi:MAG TPA: hypothetical protein VEH08_06430 [Methanomassiliicoccales archaeon]|nr:hypothetical protein [Methanomassiliicoccales archaeon]